ncbi:MAG: hypothetical protein M5R36_12080 [Deltaproteobacteria bacterium]|nr:hypothetical protein [Deltaproteobacteria bacterium]
MPGSVNAVMSQATSCRVSPRACMIGGNAGAMDATPITAMSVTANTTSRFGSR